MLRKRTRNQLDITIGNREESAYQVQGLESMIGSVNSKFTIHGWHSDQVGLESETADHTPLIRFPSSKKSCSTHNEPCDPNITCADCNSMRKICWEKGDKRKHTPPNPKPEIPGRISCSDCIQLLWDRHLHLDYGPNDGLKIVIKIK